MCQIFYGEKDISLQAHHIIPRKLGGFQTMDNLITLCNICHNKAELEGLSKNEILSNGVDVDINLYAPNKDWHKWVYGGYRKPI